jgi:hypothetical protein
MKVDKMHCLMRRWRTQFDDINDSTSPAFDILWVDGHQNVTAVSTSRILAA